MTETAPTPYKFCNPHMKPSYGANRCMVCFPLIPGEIEPPPPVRPTGAPEAGAVTKTPVAEAPPPPLTNPLAQKVVQAAQDYARAVEAVSVITQQVNATQELLDGLKKQLKGNQDLAEAAQSELRNAAAKK